VIRRAFSRQDFALEHPDLDPDDAVGRLGFRGAELDVGAKRVERHASLAVGPRRGFISLPPSRPEHRMRMPLEPNFIAVEDRLLHGAAEGDAALELGRDVLGDELGVGFGLAHFLDVDEDLVLGERLTPGNFVSPLRPSSGCPSSGSRCLAALADDHAGRAVNTMTFALLAARSTSTDAMFAL